MDRFLRLEKLITKEKVDLLKNKSILVLGCGGVGGYVIESLARSGIGRLIMVDKDIVDDVTKTYDLMNSNKDNNLSSINSINEPFSNNLIMSNFPSNYSSIGLSGDFGQNVMGSKNKKK